MNKIALLIGIIFILQTSNSQYYYNRAFSFSGATGTYGASDPGANLSITGSYTIECWVKPVNVVTPAFQIIVQKRLGAATSGYTMYLSSGKIALRNNGTTILTATTVIPNGVWTHIAGTYNSTSGVFTAYVNGVADGTITNGAAVPNADADSLRLAAGFNSPFAGEMDEIRIWNVERTAAQISGHMRLPLAESGGQDPGLVASWRANTISAGSGLEEINGYTMHLNGAATYANYSNEPGGYLAFNTGLLCTGAATGTCVTIPNATQLAPTTAMTIECWLKTDNAAIQVIVGKGSAGYGYRMLKSTSNTFRVILNGGTAMGSGNYGGIIPVNKWVHLAFTYDAGTGNFAYYMNGVQTLAGTQSVGNITATSDAVTVGGGPSQVTLSGIVDELRICNYAKTAGEVLGGMYTSIDSLNAPHPASTNVTYSFEGSLAGTNGAPRGAWTGTGIIRFTQVYNNATEFPAPIDRCDADNLYYGFNTKYSDMTFGASPTTITDSIYVPLSASITDVNVFAAITHTYANDISISLKNPAGSTTRILYPGSGSNAGMHMITIFDDQADSTIGGTVGAPWSPRVKPTNALNVFNGQNSQGWWKLIITDGFPGADDGTLIGWGVQINNQSLVGVNNNLNTGVPKVFALYQNYPNPFNPATVIRYDVPKDVKVNITVYDILGRKVQTLVDDFKQAGSYSVTMNGLNLASGVYLYRIEAGSFISTKKMLLVK